MAARGGRCEDMNRSTEERCTIYATEKVTIRILEEWCKGCEICVDVCKKHCLAMDILGASRSDDRTNSPLPCPGRSTNSTSQGLA